MKTRVIDFSQGLNTQTIEETTEWPVFRDFQNFRSRRVGAEKRPGCVRIARFAASDSIIDFDGTNDSVAFDYDARTIGRLASSLSWSIEFLAQVDSLASQRTIVNHGSQLSIHATSASSGSVIATITDGAAGTLTLTLTGIAAGTRLEGRLSRTGSLTYTLEVNDSSTSGTGAAAIATSTSALHVGSTGGASNFMDGRIERVTLTSPYRTGRMGLCGRTLNPRAPSVLLDAVIQADSNGYVLDRSAYGLHGAASGSPATTSSLLSVNHRPIQAIGQARGNSKANLVYVVAGGGVYPVTL